MLAACLVSCSSDSGAVPAAGSGKSPAQARAATMGIRFQDSPGLTRGISKRPASTPTDKVMQDWDHGQEIRLTGSSVSSTLAQMRTHGPVDWYPGDHPEMPEIVARGRKGVQACQSCHYSTGKGDPANASIQDLPYSYFVQTMEDFKAGLRKSADPRKNNTNSMIAYAKGS